MTIDIFGDLVEVYGDRVRAARTLRRKKSVDVAEALGWSPARQTRIEQAETTTFEMRRLERLSEVLGFPGRYFLTPPPPPLSADDLLFRAPVATTKREKGYLAEFVRSCGEVLDWLNERHALPPVRLPSLSLDTPAGTSAARARDALGVAAHQPIGNLVRRAERAGLPIVLRGGAGHIALHDPEDVDDPTVSERHLGYSARVGEFADRPVTVLKWHPSWERIRWTVCHEIGHVLLHGRSLPANAEDQADRFASELLAPAETVSRELPRHVTLASLTDIKLRWGISLGALITHLHNNNLIDEERFGTLRRQLYTRTNPETGRTWGKDEPGWDSREVEQPRMLATWMERCIGTLSPTAIARKSDTWPADLIADMLGNQRERGQAGVRRSMRSMSGSASVVNLAEWRLREG